MTANSENAPSRITLRFIDGPYKGFEETAYNPQPYALIRNNAETTDSFWHTFDVYQRVPTLAETTVLLATTGYVEYRYAGSVSKIFDGINLKVTM